MNTLLVRTVIGSAIFICCSLLQAADLNGYTAKYELRLVVPVPKGDVNCSGSSAKNPNSNNEYIIRDNAGWKKINDSSYSKFFVCPRDYRSKGKITITRSGSGAANRRWIVLWYPGIDTNGHPGRARATSLDATPPIPASKQALVLEFDINGASWVAIDRITIIPSGGKGVSFSENRSQNVIINRVLVEADDTGPSTSSNYGIRVAGVQNVNIQNSVIRNCAKYVNKDSYGVHISSYSKNVRLVNNEIYNCGQAYMLGGSDAGEGFISENNDLYFTPDVYMKCGPENGIKQGQVLSDVSDPNGACMCAEAVLNHKSGSVNPANPSWVIRNRMWGAREQGHAWNGTKMTQECGGSGQKAGNVIATLYYARNIIFEYNTIFDSERGFRPGIDNHHTLTSPPKHFENTFRSNLIFNIRDYGGTETAAAIHIKGGDRFEISHNTISDSDVWLYGNRNHEVACNLIVNGGEIQSTGDKFRANQNAYVNTTQHLGEKNNAVYNKTQAKLQSHSFYRKLLTGPEKIVVPNVRPDANSPVVGYCSSFVENSAYGAQIN